MRAALALTLALAACGPTPQAPAADQSAPSQPAAAAPAPARQESPLPATHPWSPSGYALSGTAPAWGGTVTGSSIRYMVPEDQFGRMIETRVANAPDSETYSGTHRGRPFVLTLTAGPCSDGVSDHVYAFTARLEVGGETRRGCSDPE